MNKLEIYKIVIDCVQRIVDTFPESDRFEVVQETILFGLNSKIDSLSLVSVIVDLESYFFDELQVEISLTDDRAMTREISPFLSVSNLADYIEVLLAEVK